MIQNQIWNHEEKLGKILDELRLIEKYEIDEAVWKYRMKADEAFYHYNEIKAKSKLLNEEPDGHCFKIAEENKPWLERWKYMKINERAIDIESIYDLFDRDENSHDYDTIEMQQFQNELDDEERDELNLDLQVLLDEINDIVGEDLYVY